MIERASTNNSIAHVIAHENRHLAHYRNKAIYDDKEIVRENITVEYKFIDGKLVAVAGEATATLKDKPEDEKSLFNPEGTSSGIDQSQGSAESDTDTNTDKSDEKKKTIDTLLSRIDMALNSIDNKINSVKNGSDSEYAIETDKEAQLKYKKALLEAKKQEIESKRNELNAEELEKMTEELLKSLSGLVENALNIMLAGYSIKTGNQNSGNSDNNTEVSVPDYSMMFTGMLLDTIV